MKYILLIFFSFFLWETKAQYGVKLNTVNAQESYTLYSDETNTFLIDNCGGIINTWPYGRQHYHLHPKLLPNGNLIFILESNGDYRIKEHSWDGQEVANVKILEPNIIPHYEVIKLENGNYLTVGREILNIIDFIELGYNVVDASPLYMDMVLEINPQGEIIWRWNIKDHIVQDRDPSLTTYGEVYEHPELIDMDAPIDSYDWNFTESFMINSFDYNPDLDQLALSVRKIGEIIIIDHGTTSAEAAGHSGGRYGKGGDLLWRWGNPENYNPDNPNRYLYYQHNPKWIKNGPYKGMLTCFNNGLDRPNTSFNNRYSQIPIIDTKVNTDGSYSLVDGVFSPDGLVKVYDKFETNTNFYSSYTSGAEMLDNGNIHITIGQAGRMIEINPDGEEVWRFDIRNDGYIYRSEKYPPTYPAFIGRNMTPISEVPSQYNCMLFTTTVELSDDTSVEYSLYENRVVIKSEAEIFVFISDIYGRQLHSDLIQHNSREIMTNNLPKGVYFLSFLQSKKPVKTIKFIK